MLTLSCLCGHARATIARLPDYVHDCNCTLCSKTGARWGYFHPTEVTTEGTTTGYCRADKDDPGARIRFCPDCGATTHFTLTESAIARFGNSMMGVNLRLADERDLAGVQVRYPDGRAWAGHGDFDYVQPPRIIGESPASR